MKVNALVYSPHEAAIKEYYNLFLNCRNINPIFLVATESSYEKLIDKEGWTIQRLYSQVEPSRLSSLKKSILDYVKRRIIDDSFFGVGLQKLMTPLLSDKLVNRLLKLKSELNKAIADKSIACVFVANDRSHGYEGALLLAAAESKIPSFIVPFAFSATYESCLTLRTRKIYKYNTRSKCNSNFSFEGKIYNFYRPWEKRALEKLSRMPENPWILGGSGFVKVLLDSEREFSRLTANGAKPSNYMITGSVAHDRLFKCVENSVSKSGDSLEEYILLALPQYFEHKICAWPEHFNLVSELVDGLSQLNRKIVISLHPKMDPNMYEFLARDKNVEVTTKDIIELIPNSSLFVCNYSSTIAWALICKKPTVIIDHLMVNYSDFFDEYDIKRFYSNNELFDGLNNSNSFDDYRSEYSTTGLSPFDGKCALRIESEVLKIVETS